MIPLFETSWRITDGLLVIGMQTLKIIVNLICITAVYDTWDAAEKSVPLYFSYFRRYITENRNEELDTSGVLCREKCDYIIILLAWD
jgi:hypothetical protein